MEETIYISKCCREKAVEGYKPNPDPLDKDYEIEISVCTKCLLECEVEEVCAFCLGDGEVSTDETDSDGNVMRGVGTQKCVCRLDDGDYDEEERY